VTNISNENQQEFWQDSMAFLYCFPNEYCERDLNFSEISDQSQIKFWDQYTLKKADPETFSFWVNDVFAKKHALFDICGLMQYQKSIYQDG